MPAAPALLILPDDLAELRRWARSAQLPAVLAQRARILLLAADGVTNTHIAERVGVTRPTLIARRRRYVHRWLDGLSDRPRPGRPLTVCRARRARILLATLNPPPPRLGITHWSTRLLARELDVSRDTVARIWREHGVQPWRVGTFKFSTDLIAAISRFCTAWNQRCQPLSWAKSADEILSKLDRQTTSATQHSGMRRAS